jgi:hypothetical protein
MTASAASRPSRIFASIALAGSLFAGCHGGSPPSTPTQPSAAVTALTLTQPAGTLKAGDTYQVVATATLSDGRTATTGFDLKWASADEAIATVNASGLVTARADGSAVITATASAIAATATIRVKTGGRTLSGLVTQTSTGPETPIVGASVIVVGGVYNGLSAPLTDTRGRFSLVNVNGPLKVRVSAPFFQDAETTADAGSSVAVRLAPAPGMIVDMAGWDGSSNERVYYGLLSFVQRRTGPARVRVSANLSSDAAPRCGELRDDEGRLLWREGQPWTDSVGTTLTLTGGKTYTLKVYDCSAERPTLIGYALYAGHT